MRLGYSLRFRLMVFYLLIFLVPAVIIMTAMPLVYQRSLSTETKTLTEGTITSIGRNIETYLDDLNRLTIAPYLNDEVMRALKLKASAGYASADPYDRLLADRALTTTLPLFLQNSRRDILATVLVASDGTAFIASSGNAISEPVPGYPYAKQDWYQKALAANGNVVFVSSHPQYYLQRSTRQVFSVARLIKDPDTGRPLAVIMADADTSVLARIVGGIKFNVSSIIWILDDENKLLYSSMPIPPGVQTQDVQLNGTVKLGNQSYSPVTKKIGAAPWQVVVLLSDAEIVAKTRWIYATGLLFAAAGLVTTFLLFFILSRWIIRPFHEMIGVMKQVETGNLQARFLVRGNDEISELGRALNGMVERLKHLIDREYKAVINQRTAEYHALQSQIQPHFLYNTLNGFIGLNRLRDSAGLEKAIYALSGMLHYTLEGEDWVELDDEIKFLQKYCDLQLLRFRDRLTIEIRCEPTLLGLRVPRLLLQPLVENAFIHGVEPSGRRCRVSVIGELVQRDSKSFAQIRVEDDGQGFDPASLEEQESLGLKNVRERLEMAFKGATFSIESAINSGTRVVIEIPLKAVTEFGGQAELNENL